MKNSIHHIYSKYLPVLLKKLRLTVFFGLFFSSGITYTQDTLRIMPLGNSITHGTQCTNGDIFSCVNLQNEDAVGYRDSLDALIDAVGYPIDYVGSETAGSNFLEDPDHAGFPGISSDNLAQLMETGSSGYTGTITPGPYLNFYPADIIILHIGTNDVLAGDTIDVSGVERILNAIDAYETSSGRTVMVFLATVLSQKGDPCGTNQGVTSFNTRLDSLASVRIAAGDSLQFLDFECGIGLDYDNDLIDQVHPNDAGYDKMAEGWFAEIGTFLQVAVTHNITTTPGTNGSIYPEGIVTVYEGDDPVFEIIPDTGYNIDDVLVNGVSQGPISSYQFTDVAGDSTLSASFVIKKFEITTSVTGNGSISPTGPVSVDYGSDQLFNINPEAGYEITDVLVDGSSVGAVSSYTFTNVTSNHTISATFEQITHTITATATGNGTISPSGTITVVEGGNESFTITPDTNHEISDVLVNGSSEGPVTSWDFTNVTSDQTIEAIFVPITHTITASAGASGTIDPSGTITVNQGNDQSFAITPATGYNIDSVVVDGTNEGAISNYIFTNVNTDHTISASFVIKTYEITTSVNGNGSISPVGPVYPEHGSDQTFDITPDPGYEITDVQVDGSSIGVTSSYTFTNINSTHSISATFELITYTISASVSGNGTISPSGTITVAQGDNQSFSITPDPDHEITSVLVNGSNVGAVSSYEFVDVQSDQTIVAIFDPITHEITASAGPNGDIDPSGSVFVNQGSDQSFNITPNTGYDIDDVLVDGTSQGAISSFTFSDVNTSHTISASFIIKSYEITTSVTGNGSISPAGPVFVDHGSSQTFDITPDAGYQVTEVFVDGTSIGVTSSYTFINVTEAHTISATFSAVNYTISASTGSNGSISPSGSVSVQEGNDQSFTITPATNYQIADVLVDGISQGAISSYTFVNVTENHTISASFEAITHTITASAGTNGSISPSGNVTVNQGDDQTFNFTPATGYEVDKVLVDGTDVGAAVSSYTFTNVTTDHNISVSFVLKTYEIIASAGPEGSISPSGIVNVTHGSDQTFSITPSEGYEIADVEVDGTSVGPVANYTFDDVITDHTISATFSLKTYTINAASGPNGSISPSGSVSVDHGSDQTFNITPQTGYEVDDVLVNGLSVGPVSSYTFSNVTSDQTISVSFIIKTYTINATAGLNGSISPSGNVNVDHGDNQSFTITPATGYEIASVLVDGVSVGAVSTYTFSNVTTDHTIEASFIIKTYTITASAGPNGSITPSGNVNVNHGDDQSFTIIPDEGYEINNVRVDGVSVGAVSSYTFSNVITDHTISVNFVIKTYTISASSGPNGSIDPPGDTEVNHGSSQSYDIIPDEGYEIDDVLVDGVSVGPVSTYTFSDLTSNHTISASFILKTYIIRSTAGPNGTIDPFGDTEVNHGASQTYLITPDIGYNIDDVRVDGISVGAVSSYTFSDITEDHTISVSFVIKTYTISASSGPDGIITPAGDTEADHGSSVTYTFTPDEGYEVEDVLVNGASIGAVDEYTFTNITEDHTISVSFIIKTYIITSSAGPNGTITPLGDTEVDHGSSQIYVFTPDEGYEVEDVLVDGISIGAADEYTFTNITEGHTISVSFVIKTFIITSAAGPNGTITPLGETELEYGSEQVYTITPEEGYEIEDVIVDGVSVGVVEEYTFTNITEAHTISVVFVIKTYLMSSSSGINGQIAPVGDTIVEHGTSLLYTFIPDEGYEVEDVIVDGISIGAVDEYSFIDISEPHTISVNFILKTYIITSIAGENGTITPLGETEVDHGSDLEYTITPDIGYEIDDVFVNGTSVGAPAIYTFTNISSEHIIEVSFIKVIEVIQVSIPDTSMKINDEITASFTLITDAGIPYSLVSGQIGGYTLTNLQRVDTVTYTADFIIQENGNSYTAGQNIPVSNLVFTDGTVQNDPYEGFIVQGNDPVDAERPVINFVWVEAGNKKVGETVRLIINADNINYTIDSSTSINGIPVSDPNIVFTEVGSGTYSIDYTVIEGDNDVAAGELQASIVLVKPSGNTNEPYTNLNNSSELTIDANSPVVTTMEVPPGEVGIGDVVEVTITSDGTGYRAGNGTVINEIPLSSSRVTFTQQSDSIYLLSYTVAIGDNSVPTGGLELTLYLEDAAGNSGGPFTKLEPNSLSVYTELPTATIAGTQSVCEEETAELTVYLTGRSPWSIYLSDGTNTTLYSDINTNIFKIEVLPEKTTIYRIDLVSDANGTLNTGTGSAKVSLLEKTDVQITNTKTTFSIESDPLQLLADVSGGIFTGPGVNSSTGIFDPAVADTVDSPHMIYYTYQNSLGCTSMDSILMFVLGAQGDVFLPKSFYCGYEDPFTVTGTNVSEITGSFRLLNIDGEEVAGLTDNRDNTAEVDPGLLADGNYTVEYAYFDEVMLFLRESFLVETVAEPVILLPEADEVCQNAQPLELSSSTAGAVFTGPGVSGNSSNGFYFNPAEAFIGNNEITLSNTSMSGCSVSVSKTIKVNKVPNTYFIVDKFCVSSKDTVFFSNTTLDKYLISDWSWNFDDPESGDNNTSTEETPWHIYNEAGTRTIQLIGQTETGCSDTIRRTIDFGDNPTGSVSWDNECFVESGPVKFTSEMSSSNNIIKYQWKITNPEGDSIMINGGKSINYGFDELDRYNVEVTAETEIGCRGTAEREIVLKPIIQLTDENGYFEDFNSNDGWWSAEMDDSSSYLSWDYKVVNFENMNSELSRGWYTKILADSIFEYSAVHSPCFDFSELKRPMISLDIYRSLARNNEGIVLQATTDGGQTWENIGKPGDGINWYNSNTINPGPGGQSAGWTGEDPFQADQDWIDARNDMNMLAGKEKVQFRIAYAATHSATDTVREGFAFDNVRIGNRTRKVLLEHFTNTASGNTREVNGVINNIYNQYYDDMVKLEFHTSFPGADPFNEHNSSVPATRSLYYGVSSVPYSILDGGFNESLRYNFTSNELEQKDINYQYLHDALFDINVNSEISGNQLNVDVAITAREDLPPVERIVHIVVFEKLITGISTLNGATNFLNVVKDMLPNSAGTAEFDGWFEGQTRNYQYSWNIENVYDPEMIRVAAFIQNDNTREVHQVNTNDSINLTTSVSPGKERIFSLQVYPNPAEDHLYVKIKSDESYNFEVEIYDQVGRMVLQESIYEYESLKRLDIEPLDKGVYYLRIRTGDMEVIGFERIVIMN